MTVNRRYHASIYGACHNPVLIETLDALWDRSDRYRRAVGFMATDAAIQDEHVAIAEAVLARRADESASLMRGPHPAHAGDVPAAARRGPARRVGLALADSL